MCNPASYLCHHRPPPSSPTLWIGCSEHPTPCRRYRLIPINRTCKFDSSSTLTLTLTSISKINITTTSNSIPTPTPSGTATGTGIKSQHPESHAPQQKQQRPQPQSQKLFCQRCRDKWGIEGLYEREVMWRVGMVDEILGGLDAGAGSLREMGMGFRYRLSGKEIQEGMRRAGEMFREEGL